MGAGCFASLYGNGAKMMKKNKKGFSLVELIVVLVIMAILAAALVPTLIGYIRQTREQDARSSAASCVQAAQTIVSSAYADSEYTYHGNVEIIFSSESGTFALPEPETTFCAEVARLAEQDGTVSEITVDENYKINHLKYVSTKNNSVAVYSDGDYAIEE